MGIQRDLADLAEVGLQSMSDLVQQDLREEVIALNLQVAPRNKSRVSLPQLEFLGCIGSADASFWPVLTTREDFVQESLPLQFDLLLAAADDFKELPITEDFAEGYAKARPIFRIEPFPLGANKLVDPL